MTIRTDVTFNMELSPRLITVAAPSTEITLQDFHDTAVDFEDSPEGHQYPRIVLSAGKEALGGGVTVGITSTMQNAQLSFEARVTDLEEGTVTTAGPTGKVLIDSTALFQTNLVGRGDIIYNQTDDSKATVLSVDSETQITHTVLIGGTDNDWDMSDAYEIYDVQQCNISGGNLVAVDDVGAELDPVFPTFGTQVVRTASSSATLQNAEQLEAASFAPDLGVHVDAVNGSDVGTLPGTREEPVKTETGIETVQAQRGFRHVYLLSNFTITLDHSAEKHIWKGDDPNDVTITLDPSCDVTDNQFNFVQITGKLDSGNILERCIVSSITNANGFISESTLVGPIVASANLSIPSAFLPPGVDTVTIDFDSLAIDIKVPGALGLRLLIKNMVTGSVFLMEGAGGKITFDSTCIGGTAKIYGGIEIVNNGTLDDFDDDSLFTRTEEVSALHGLKTGTNLVVDDDANTRTAGSITQTVNTVGNVTTITRTG